MTGRSVLLLFALYVSPSLCRGLVLSFDHTQHIPLIPTALTSAAISTAVSMTELQERERESFDRNETILPPERPSWSVMHIGYWSGEWPAKKMETQHKHSYWVNETPSIGTWEQLTYNPTTTTTTNTTTTTTTLAPYLPPFFPIHSQQIKAHRRLRGTLYYDWKTINRVLRVEVEKTKKPDSWVRFAWIIHYRSGHQQLNFDHKPRVRVFGPLAWLHWRLQLLCEWTEIL